MNSSWLLFKTQRRGLLICGGLCFLAQFLLVYADIRPSDLDKAATISGLSLIFALLLGCVARFHTAPFKLPSPVTHRQLVWIPTLCLAVLWAAGFAGVFTGIGVLSVVRGPSHALPQWIPFLLAILRLVPLSFLVFAVFDRCVRYMGLGAFGFAVWPIIFLNMRDQLEGLEPALAFYHYGWPLCLVLGVFFILEAPAHIAAMDYPALLKQGLVSAHVRPPGAATRTPAMKVWADVLMALLCVLVVVCFFSRLYPSSGLGSISPSFRVYLAVHFAGIVVAVLFGTRAAWRSTHANGFAAGKALVIFLLQCSVVLLPIAWALGAKRGVVATCVHCRQYKFLWARHCPHCGHANQGTIVRISPLHFWKKDKGTPLKKRQVSPRTLYRFLLPFYLVVFSFISYEGRFRSESFTLTPTQQGLETAFDETREYLASVEDARSWLGAGGEEPLLLPEQFRIEALELGSQVLEVKCYWLRWEDAGEVGERLRARILEASATGSYHEDSHTHRNDYARGRVNRAALPSFLDGRIHWTTK